MYACLAVTCRLHFWQNVRGLLRTTAVTRGVERTPDKSQHTKLTLVKKILPPPNFFTRFTFWMTRDRLNHSDVRL